MKVYIDDMLVKSQQAGDHIQHLSNTFQILRKFNMKLNPEKCAFGVASGKFLVFLVSNCGIEVNPKQIKAIEEIPDTLTSKKEDQFEWSEECQQTLKNLKVYLSNPSLLAKPKDGEKPLNNLVVSEVAVSVVLAREDQVTAYPLCNILHKHELLGRLDKWVIELSEYDITYQPRTAIKSQVLADFVADFSQGIQLEAKKELQVFNGSNPGTWTLFIDGSSNVKGACLGIVFVPPTGETIRQAIKCYHITNNEAEYEAVIAAREARMQQYLKKARDLVRQFQTWKVVQIPREENAEADALANLASVAEITNDENASVIHLFHSVLDQDKNEYGILPEDKKKAQALRKKAAQCCLKQGNLYRKMFGGPLARCLRPSQTEYMMR
ncbi:uncharacterized protein [Nicotiana sylvestris]|uniref:uncharacterized protein n=1 Tax=Nicotiana sylvestris TaxID=4096 RepID=UPI00388CDE3B